MASEEQRARRVGEGFLRLADDRRHAGPADDRRPAARRDGRGADRGLAGRDRHHRRERRGRRLERRRRAAVRPRALAGGRPGARLPDLPRPPADGRSRRPAAPGRRTRRWARPAPDRARRPAAPTAARSRSTSRRRRSSSTRRGCSPSTSATPASAASASASSTPTPGGARRCSTSARSRSRAWPSTSFCSAPSRSSIDELGVDRCEVWKRDEGGETLTLRASVGWPEAEAGTQVPLATANQPGYTMLRGQGAIVVEDFRREGRFGPIGPTRPRPAQSAISVRIPGTQGGFGIARRRLREPAPLRAQRHQPVRVARADARRGDRALPGRATRSPHAEQQIRQLIERLPSITYRAGLGPAGEWDFISPQVEEIIGYTVEEWMADPKLWEPDVHPDDLERVLEAENACAPRDRPLDIEYRIRRRDGRDDLGPRPGLRRRGRRATA